MGHWQSYVFLFSVWHGWLCRLLETFLLLAPTSHIVRVSSYPLGFSLFVSPVGSIYFNPTFKHWKLLRLSSRASHTRSPLCSLGSITPFRYLMTLKFLGLPFEFKTYTRNYLPAISIWMFPKVEIFSDNLASLPVFSTLTNQTTRPIHSTSWDSSLALHRPLLINQLILLVYPPHGSEIQLILPSLLLWPYSNPLLLKCGPCLGVPYSPWSWLETQCLRPHPDLLNQNLHLVRTPGGLCARESMLLPHLSSLLRPLPLPTDSPHSEPNHVTHILKASQ